MCAVYREAPVIQHLHHDLEYLYILPYYLNKLFYEITNTKLI